MTEVAIPCGELPHVRALLDAGRTVRFRFRVNDKGGGPVLESAKGRSVSWINAAAFQVDWREHWANEIEFGLER